EGSAEVYDPTTGTWAATGNMVTGHYGYTPTLLSDGRVLVAGDNYNPGVDPDAEIYDPTSGTWTATGRMIAPRFGAAVALLDDGKVLVAGGAAYGDKNYLASAEVYDPASDTWTAIGDMAMGRGDFTATLLTDGSVLVVGGLNHNGGGVEWASAELYDPVSGTWTATGSMGGARYGHTASRLLDGRVLVVGGFNTDLNGTNGPVASAQLYDPGSGSWSATANAVEPRAGATATILSDGMVLVTGGIDINGTALTTAELYDPGSGS
ncbi:MAG: kelch repeat-containing protein, partial [Chloroflexota bacterium]